MKVNNNSVPVLEIFKDFKKTTEIWAERYKNISFVFNNNLIPVNTQSDITHIIVGDNPGINEMEQSKYLIGKAGQVCRNFFKENIHYAHEEFDKNVIVLNKTPIFTKSTDELKKIDKNCLDISMKYMSDLVICTAGIFPNAEIWIIGKSKLTTLFKEFSKNILDENNNNLFNRIYIFKHFSFGGFSKDFKNAGSEINNLKRYGSENQKIIRYYILNHI